MNSRKKILLGVAALVVVGAAGYYFTRSGYTEPDMRLASNGDQAATTETIEESRELTLIYSEEVKTTQDASRSWPTVNIMRKIGEGKAEVLATIGKVGEYPNGFLMSKHNKALYINLETKIQKLDLQTKKLTDVIKAKKQFNSFVLSPDESKMFIWDQQYASGDLEYYVHVVDLRTLKDTVLPNAGELTEKGFFFAKQWRNDDKIILVLGSGEAGWTWYYDLKTNQVVESPGNLPDGNLSASGNLIAVVVKTVGDACNEFSASSPSLFNLVDPVTGKISYKDIGRSNMIGEFVAFSPDDAEVMYSTRAVNDTSFEICSQPQEKKYYVRNLATGQEVQQTNYVAKLKEWHLLTAGIQYSYSPQNDTATIKLGDEALFIPVATRNAPTIIKVY